MSQSLPHQIKSHFKLRKNRRRKPVVRPRPVIKAGGFVLHYVTISFCTISAVLFPIYIISSLDYFLWLRLQIDLSGIPCVFCRVFSWTLSSVEVSWSGGKNTGSSPVTALLWQDIRPLKTMIMMMNAGMTAVLILWIYFLLPWLICLIFV